MLADDSLEMVPDTVDRPAGDMPDLGPIVILTAARSGSTLLRFLLDAHPDLACPPEAGLGLACAGLARVWSILNAADPLAERDAQPANLAPDAALRIHDTLSAYYDEYLQRHGKRRWVDKSLDNCVYARLITEVFPESRFICLYRSCLDMVASGIESSPWGLAGFGFAEFARQYPNNNVAAVGSYWLDSTRRILAFEEEFADRCLRIRYEDLVSNPEGTAERVFSFVGARQVPGISEWCLNVEHDRSGPGDQKIWFTKEISNSSIGRGVQIPVSHLPPQVLRLVNETLPKLGYRTIDEAWNRAVGNVDPRAGEEPAVQEDAEGAAFRDAVLALIAEQLSGAAPGFNVARWPSLADRHVHVAVEADGCTPAELKWTFGASSEPAPDPGALEEEGAAGGCALVTAPASIWRSVLAGEVNMAMEIAAGRMRCVSPVTAEAVVTPEAYALAEALGLASSAGSSGRASTAGARETPGLPR